MNAPLKKGESLKAAAQQRLEQMSGRTFARTFARTFDKNRPHLCSENAGATVQPTDARLLERCKTACRGLSLWPQELAAALDEGDREAILSGDPAELAALRTFAEGLAARLRTGKLPPGIPEAYDRLRAELKRRPEIRTAVEVLTPDSDPVLLAVAIRGIGCATLRIARERYDAGKLIEIIDRTTKEGKA